MADNPLVSVVIPCLNRAHYLVPTIESVLEQDYPNIECIVVDGGSTDGTVAILKQYGDRVKWVSEPDDGHADAINKGWHMSKGEILAWLNADDIYVVPSAVSSAVAWFRNNPELDLVYGDYSVISESGEVIHELVKPRRWDLTYAVKYCDYIIPQPAAFMHRRILEKVDWLDPLFRNCKDHELWLRIGLVGNIEYAPMHLASARRCPGLSQRADVGTAKVALTEKFFRQPDLPPPFNSPQFRKRAMSNTYLVGAEYIWIGTKRLRDTSRFILRALETDPWNLPAVLVKALKYFVLHAVPQRLKDAIKSLCCRGPVKNSEHVLADR